MKAKGFAPCCQGACDTLILGSFPSVKSRETDFYYGHPQNRFWKVLAGIRHKIGQEKIRNTMRTVGLDPDLKLPVKKYSLGMRQRLGLAQAIMEEPSVLILDEPMNGLDRQGVEEIRSLLLSLKAHNKLIVIASHNAEDIKVLCDRVYEMDNGIIQKSN